MKKPTSLEFAPSTVGRIPLMVCIAISLIVSGVLHLGWLMWTGSEWDGPLSLRKPALFGISGALTVWSVAWVITKLYPHRTDRLFANSMGWGLLLEVALITGQQWRGVASHFNHATTFDATIETAMLVLISYVTLGILILAIRSIWLPSMPAEMKIAIRGGLWLLVVSCGLGFVANIVGEWNIASGNSPSLYSPSGVLKYPHGAALHSIQLLPLLAWLLPRLSARAAARHVTFVLASQIAFLLHALWQTFHGRDRLNVDLVGGSLLVAAVLLLLPTGIAILRGISSFNAWKRMLRGLAAPVVEGNSQRAPKSSRSCR